MSSSTRNAWHLEAQSGPGASNAVLIGRLLKLGWRYRWLALKVLILQSILLFMTLSGLGLTGLGVDVIYFEVRRANPPRWPLGWTPPEHWTSFALVALVAAGVVGLATLRFFLDYRNHVALATLVQNIVVDLRARVYDKLQRLSFRFYDANESGSIINRVTGDVQAVRMFVDQVLVQTLLLIISLTFFMVYMLSIHVWLTLACLATTPLLAVLTVIFSRIVKPAYRKNRELFDNTIRVLSENVSGVHVVKGFGLQQQQIDKFDQANRSVRDQKRWIFWRVSTFSPTIHFITQINLVVLLGYGGYLVMIYDPEAGVGIPLGSGLLVFSGLLQQFSTQVGNIAQIANSVQQSLTGAQRVFEVLDTPVEIQNKPDAIPLKRVRGRVVFENVSFGYSHDPQDRVLEGINLTVEPGQCVALLGATGAGKSTLLSLVPRFYDPLAGRVLVDDHDVSDVDLDDLRRDIGLVFQESFLFSNTVAANIAFGHPEASREMIEKAAKIASAHDFIMELPHGYDTVIGERGSNLSGGQRQRLAIARAILLEPQILLLDDPTAAIDPETEHEILSAMDSAMQGRTTFVVAHRLSTLRRADVVVVLDKGRIVQQGTHEELMNARGHYRRAAKLQIADEESKRLLGIGT